MKRFLSMALVATTILAGASTARADGWVHFHHGYVPYHFTRTLGDTPSREELKYYFDARREAIQRALDHHQVWLEGRRQQIVEQQATAPPHHRHYGGSAQALICSYSWSCAVALCIVGRESNFNPNAYNSSSGAAGWWQWLPAWYRGHFDPFDPVASTAFAWHRYNQSGWSDWHSDKHPCY